MKQKDTSIRMSRARQWRPTVTADNSGDIEAYTKC